MDSNPFATRFVRPGAIKFLFLDGDSAERIIDRLRNQNWCGQIIGPHGSGKSTLLATLTPLLQDAGRFVLSFKVGPGERRLRPLDSGAITTSTQIIIDGYEQLSWWAKWKVRGMVAKARAGLLVTAHTNVNLPTLYETKPSAEVMSAVVTQLAPNALPVVTSDEIANAYREAGGNMRETLFKLFDVYRQRQGNST